jgi:lysophospholipase L1-like esterase
VDDPELSWRMLPGRAGRYFLTDGVRTNALGLRGPPLPANRPDDELRLLVLGDSITFGFRVAEAERWSDRLAELLARQLPGRRVVPVNAGVVGYSTTQGRAVLPGLLATVRPDVVIACFGANDCITLAASDATLAAVTRSAPERLRRALRRSQVVCALEGAVALLRRELDARATGRRLPVVRWLHYPTVPAAPDKPPRTSETEHLAHVDAMLAACRAADVPFVVLNEFLSPTVPGTHPMQPAYFERTEARFDALQRWAEARSVPLADVRGALRNSGLPDTELLHDPFHPTPAGHAAMAAEVARTLRAAGLPDRWRGR